jgi:hypothetical protein
MVDDPLLAGPEAVVAKMALEVCLCGFIHGVIHGVIP